MVPGHTVHAPRPHHALLSAKSCIASVKPGIVIHQGMHHTPHEHAFNSLPPCILFYIPPIATQGITHRRRRIHAS
ncbi:hypothetical protein BDZ89DRAFT_1070623 [Hymenopellis radicata]|nr:hypothetical protein BDZ89DRAFT_1070623 [Hymenopellis radicata]